MDQLDALAVRLRAVAGLDGERQIEVVDDEQQILQQIDDRLVGLLAALALDALAVVVELGGLAQQAIVEVVALALRAPSGVRGSADASDASVVSGGGSAGSRVGSSAIKRLIGIAQHAGDRLRRAVDDRDGPRIAHARRTDDADRPGAGAVVVRRGDRG